MSSNQELIARMATSDKHAFLLEILAARVAAHRHYIDWQKYMQYRPGTRAQILGEEKANHLEFEISQLRIDVARQERIDRADARAYAYLRDHEPDITFLERYGSELESKKQWLRFLWDEKGGKIDGRNVPGDASELQKVRAGIVQQRKLLEEARRKRTRTSKLYTLAQSLKKR